MGYKNFRKTSIYFVLPLFSRILMGKWEGWIKKSEKEEFHMGKLMEGRFQDGVNNNSSRFVKKKTLRNGGRRKYGKEIATGFL